MLRQTRTEAMRTRLPVPRRFLSLSRATEGWTQVLVKPPSKRITIRSQVASGAQTELSKIVEGNGDWMFYGHADASQTVVEAWWLIDLKAFRAALIGNSANGHNILMGNQKNPDGTCFKWFDVRSFPAEPPLVVAASQSPV